MPNLKIIIIEDEPSISSSLKTALTKEGFEVSCLENGEDGLAAALDQKPNMILLDILLPKMDGIKTFERLRNDEWGKNVPVVIITNVTDANVEKAAKSHNPLAYYVKSNTHIADIVSTVNKGLGLKQD